MQAKSHNYEEIVMNRTRLSRRQWLSTAAAGVAASWAASSAGGEPPIASAVTNGRIKQSVCSWCFAKHWSVEQLAVRAAALGLKSVELTPPEHWPVLKKHGLICAIASSHGFARGFAHPEDHAWCAEKLRASIDACAAFGFPSVITFSGFRKGMPDDVGLENTVAGLKTVVGYAEQKNVTLCLEVLNSRVNIEMKGHPDYMADKVEWGVEVCRRIGSPRMKILFDIYHVQIMEGDIITRIKQFHPYVGHYHTAGVPGRNEIDATQEINYRPIMQTIAATGYQGYVGHEFIPTRDPLETLREAVQLCDV